MPEAALLGGLELGRQCLRRRQNRKSKLRRPGRARSLPGAASSPDRMTDDARSGPARRSRSREAVPEPPAKPKIKIAAARAGEKLTWRSQFAGSNARRCQKRPCSAV